MPTVLDEYLVRLGFTTDAVGFSGFSNALRQASSLVDTQYLGMAKSVLKFQGVVTGAFAAAGLAAVDIADKTAMADQEYRLFALHMYTSLPVARELKIALDALGQPLENVMWDPELAKRFHQLVQDQRELTEELGPSFENQMLKIRDVRFEFSRFGVELQYLTMKVVEDLAEAFGTNMDDLLSKLREFNAYFIHNMPAIAQWIASNLKPILMDVKDVLGETVVLGKDFALTFTNLVAALSGNTGLEGTTFSMQKFGEALQQASHWAKDFVVSVDHALEIVLHLMNALADLRLGNLSDMRKELSTANKLLTPGSGMVLGGTAGSAAGTAIGGAIGSVGGPLGFVGGSAAENVVGGVLGAAAGYVAGLKHLTGAQIQIKEQIIAVAHALGIPANLALAVAQQESGLHQFDKSGKTLTSPTGALGVMQLLPSTARMLGVDPHDTHSNILGGETYLRQLLEKYKTPELALEHYYGSKDAKANREYAERVLQISGVTINITAKTDATPEDIAHAVNKGLKSLTDSDKKRTQRNLGEFGGWSPAGSF